MNMSGSGRGGGRGGRGGDYYRNKYGGRGRGGGRGSGGGYYSHGRGGGGSMVSNNAAANADEANTLSNGEAGVDRSPHQSEAAAFDINAPRLGGNNGGSHADLLELLRRLDGKQYPAYHDIESSSKGWVNDMEGYSLYIARAQSDPFARPTRCRVIVNCEVAKFPPVSYLNKVRSVALGDYLNRVFYDVCKNMGADLGTGENGHGTNRGWSGSKGGDIEVSNYIFL
jgi:hypothetical protein